MLSDLWRDLIELTKVTGGDTHRLRDVSAAALQDSFSVLAISRIRARARKFHIIGLNRVLRLAQTAAYGLEIGKDVELGHGVHFVHTVGTVIGGTAKIGDRVRFMGNNTVGTAKDNGYPILEDDVVVGCGARILGPVVVGKGAIIGANAVVLHDVPPGATAIGVPATVHMSPPPSGRHRVEAPAQPPESSMRIAATREAPDSDRHHVRNRARR